MIEAYAEKIKELETKKENLLKRRDKINADIKKMESKIKDYEGLIKIQSFDSTVTVLKEYGMSIDELMRKVTAGEIK